MTNQTKTILKGLQKPTWIVPKEMLTEEEDHKEREREHIQQNVDEIEEQIATEAMEREAREEGWERELN